MVSVCRHEFKLNKIENEWSNTKCWLWFYHCWTRLSASQSISLLIANDVPVPWRSVNKISAAHVSSTPTGLILSCNLVLVTLVDCRKRVKWYNVILISDILLLRIKWSMFHQEYSFHFYEKSASPIIEFSRNMPEPDLPGLQTSAIKKDKPSIQSFFFW